MSVGDEEVERPASPNLHDHAAPPSTTGSGTEAAQARRQAGEDRGYRALAVPLIVAAVAPYIIAVVAWIVIANNPDAGTYDVLIPPAIVLFGIPFSFVCGALARRLTKPVDLPPPTARARRVSIVVGSLFAVLVVVWLIQLAIGG